jgi:hypothetical protein
VNFGTWHELLDASRTAPAEPGVLQARAQELRAYPTGKTAMILYEATNDAETLRSFVTGRGAPGLDRAAVTGARFVRFGVTAHPGAVLDRLLAQFHQRFGALPAANLPAPPRGIGDEIEGKTKGNTGDV